MTYKLNNVNETFALCGTFDLEYLCTKSVTYLILFFGSLDNNLLELQPLFLLFVAGQQSWTTFPSASCCDYAVSSCHGIEIQHYRPRGALSVPAVTVFDCAVISWLHYNLFGTCEICALVKRGMTNLHSACKTIISMRWHENSHVEVANQ